jgi:hypothetical protein
VACLATAVFFSAVQVSPAVKDFYARATALLSFWSNAPYATVTMDPTDIVAAPAVLLAWWQARRSLRQLPPGRLALVRAAALLEGEGWAHAAGVADVVALLSTDRQAHLRSALVAYGDGELEAADASLAALRA